MFLQQVVYVQNYSVIWNIYDSGAHALQGIKNGDKPGTCHNSGMHVLSTSHAPLLGTNTRLLPHRHILTADRCYLSVRLKTLKSDDAMTYFTTRALCLSVCLSLCLCHPSASQHGNAPGCIAVYICGRFTGCAPNIYVDENILFLRSLSYAPANTVISQSQ